MSTTAEVREGLSPMFRFTEEHLALREVLRSVFADDAEGAAGWRRLLRDVGADTILFDASDPASEATAIDLAILAEAAGSALYGGPIVPAVLAGVFAAAAADPSLITALREGERGIGATVGATEPVWHADRDSWLLLPAKDPDGPAWALFDGAAADLEIAEVSGFDPSRPLARVDAGAAEPLAALGGEPAAFAARTAERYAGLALSAELLGVAQYALDNTVGYVGQRVQFGRTIGSFQAIKHRLADLLAQVELARSAVFGAAWHLAGDPAGARADVDLAVAAVLSREAALHVTKAAVQLHGGIAITWEHWAHRYLRRAHAVVALTGAPAEHRRRLAALVDSRDGHRV